MADNLARRGPFAFPLTHRGDALPCCAASNGDRSGVPRSPALAATFRIRIRPRAAILSPAEDPMKRARRPRPKRTAAVTLRQKHGLDARRDTPDLRDLLYVPT